MRQPTYKDTLHNHTTITHSVPGPRTLTGARQALPGQRSLHFHTLRGKTSITCMRQEPPDRLSTQREKGSTVSVLRWSTSSFGSRRVTQRLTDPCDRPRSFQKFPHWRRERLCNSIMEELATTMFIV